MTVFRKFEVCASYESSVVKSPPSPSRKPLGDSLNERSAQNKLSTNFGRLDQNSLTWRTKIFSNRKSVKWQKTTS